MIEQGRGRPGGIRSKNRPDCKLVTPLVVWVANGTATDAERAMVVLHTLTCPHCRRELAETLALRRTFQRWVERLPDLPQRAWHGFVDLLEEREEAGAGHRTAVEVAEPEAVEIGSVLRQLLAWLAAESPSPAWRMVDWALAYSETQGR